MVRTDDDGMKKSSRLVLALDETDPVRALEVADAVSGTVDAIKINWPLVLSAGPDMINELSKRSDVICDFKVADIPNTVRLIVEQCVDRGAKAVIVHAFTGSDSMKAAVEAAGDRAGIIAVTAMSHPGGQEFTAPNAERLAHVGVECGAIGFIAPATRPADIARVRSVIGDRLILSPGVGAQGGKASDAIRAGADYVIVGRAIYKSDDPASAAEAFAEDVRSALRGRSWRVRPSPPPYNIYLSNARPSKALNTLCQSSRIRDNRNGESRMRKFGIRKAAPADADAKPQAQASEESKGGLRGHWRLLLLFVVILAAFLLRFVFAYGISADDNYALSGGASATTNLRVITEILAGTFDPANVAALNYPYGSVAVHGPFFDYLMAGIASIGTAFGMSDADAAAGALAWTAPIFGALTCVPVYLIGKKVSGDNASVGVLSAVFYATFAIAVMTTPFSNGTVVPLTALLVACLAYAIVRALEALDKAGEVGLASFVKDRQVLKHTVASAVLLTLVALTWADARVVVMVMAVCMFIGFSARRIRGKQIAGMAGALGFVILVASVVAAAYYIPVDLWDAVASGLVVLGVITAVLSFAAGALEGKSWVLTIPCFLVVVAVIAVVLNFAAIDVFDAVVHGNNVYTGTLMQDLADDMTRTDVSAMAAYYGWLTLWLPFVLGCWMLYRYRRDGGSRVYGFTVLWVSSCFLVGWFSSDYAAAAGAGFAVASAVVVYDVCKAVDLRKYFKSMRGNGFKGGIRKAAKFFPLVTVIAVVGLVAVPNAVYAVDAATPTNDEKADYFGGVGYTIVTSDASLMDSTWTHYGSEDKSGAIVTWYGYSDSAVGNGGFSSVTDSVGGGTAAMSSVYLSDGTGAAVASMAVRLMLAEDGLDQFKDAVAAAGLDYDALSGIMTDSDKARQYIADNEDDFSGLKADVDSENAVYHAAVAYMTANASDDKVCALYDSVCQTTGNRISYVEVDGGMIPMYYGDGSEFSTIAYFGGYALGDYGNPSEYYSVNAYYGYYNYTDAMYDTFLWRALLGIDATEGGASNAYSLISSLALSDGDVKAVPGYGLSGFEVSYWHVMYNPDSEATASSSGWVDMDAKEAIAKQNADGGLINYMSSVVVLEYVGYGDSTVSGKVTYTSGTTADTPAQGVKVSVYENVDYDSSGKTGYVLRSVGYTDAEGAYTVAVPEDADYYVVFSAGSDSLRGGTAIVTYDKGTVPEVVPIDKTAIGGSLAVGEDSVKYEADGYVVIESSATGYRAQADMTAGAFSFDGIMPGSYSFTAYDKAGNTVGTSTLTVPMGESEGVLVTLESGTVSVSAKDMYGNVLDEGTFAVVNVSSGVVSVGDIEDGEGTVDVPVGTYRVYLTGDEISLTTTTYSVTKGNTRSVSLVGYDAKEVTGAAGQTVMALGFSTAIGSEGKASVPALGTFAVYDATAAAGTVSGTVKNGDDVVSGATVSFTAIDKDGNTIDTIGTYVFSTDKDGKYSAALPAIPDDGKYTMYVNNGKDAAFLENITVSGDATKDVSLVAAHKITTKLVYQTYMSSSSTKGVAFADVTAAIGDLKVVFLTDTSGYGYFYAPNDNDVTFTVSKEQFADSKFTVTEDFTVTSAATTGDKIESTWTIEGFQKEGVSASVNKVKVTSDIDVTLKASNSSLKENVTEDVPVTSAGVDVVPGQYTAEIKTGGHYFSGTVYVYPSTEKLDLDVLDVTTVTVAVSEGDVVTVTAVEKESDDDEEETGTYKTGDTTSTSKVYYLEKGYDFLLTATDTDGNVAYCSITAADDVPVDMKTKAEPAKISGYVGAKADGKLTAEYGDVKIVVDVDDGKYDVTVPAGNEVKLTASVEVTEDNIVYKLEGTATLAADKVVKDGVTCNFQSLTSGAESEYAEVATITATDGSFADGKGTATVTVFNNGKQDQTYVISGGDAFVLNQIYKVTVPAGTDDGPSSATVEVSGHYNAKTVGYGNAGMTVSVTTLAGDSVAVLKVPANAFKATTSESKVSVETASAEGATADGVNGFAYKYAVTVDNPFGNALKVVLTSDVSAEGWKAAVCDSTGFLVYDIAAGTAFDVAAYGKSVVYLVLLNEDGTATDVPSASITVTVTDETGAAVAIESTKLTATDNTATGEVSSTSADVSKTDASVSGGKAENDEKEISMTFWGICIVIVVLLLLMVWGGMKRGVFTRRK